MRFAKNGGCQCGQVRFEVKGDPVKVYACHCTICQKQSGSAFGMAALYKQQFFNITKGELSNFVRDGTGKSVRNYFCPICGTRIYHQWFTSDGIGPVVNIKPGTLDDSSWLNPGCHVWTQHAQSWIHFSEDDILFEEQPADLSEMPNYKTS
jgi:hypothetical protein